MFAAVVPSVLQFALEGVQYMLAKRNIARLAATTADELNTDEEGLADSIREAGPEGLPLALELAADNILVNAVAPGPILPPPGLSDDEMRAVEETTPLGRWGGEIEIAKVVLALLASDFMTGETVRVDGGRHLR